MRIGILTFHRAYNCGAMLQAWALRKTLERMGHTVEFPTCNHVGEVARWQFSWVNSEKKGCLAKARSFFGRLLVNAFSIPNYDILRYRYRAFRRRHLPERKINPSKFDSCYELLVVGSDQVFSLKHLEDYAPTFLCENKPMNLRAIAYAASYGDKPLAKEPLNRVVEGVKRFSAVSVREKLAQKQLSEETGIAIAETLDPTLLVESADYAEIARGHVPKEPYLLLYSLSNSAWLISVARELARRLGVRLVLAPCYAYSRWGAAPEVDFCVSPDRLVQYARNAEYVLAGSFHGTIMGVVFKKPFLSIREQVDEYESRPASLLRKLGCPERLVNPKTSIEEMEALLRAGTSDCESELKRLRNESLKWLRGAVG